MRNSLAELASEATVLSATADGVKSLLGVSCMDAPAPLGRQLRAISMHILPAGATDLPRPRTAASGPMKPALDAPRTVRLLRKRPDPRAGAAACGLHPLWPRMPPLPHRSQTCRRVLTLATAVPAAGSENADLPSDQVTNYDVTAVDFINGPTAGRNSVYLATKGRSLSPDHPLRDYRPFLHTAAPPGSVPSRITQGPRRSNQQVKDAHPGRPLSCSTGVA